MPIFLTFFALPNFWGADPQQLYPYACLVAHHMEKFREVAPPCTKVIDAQGLNVRPIFECSLLKCWGTLVPGYSGICKNLRGSTPRGQNVVFQESRLGWVQTHISNYVVSGPKLIRLFRPKQEGLLSITCLQFWAS